MLPKDKMEQLIKQAFKEVLEETQLLEKMDNLINKMDRIINQTSEINHQLNKLDEPLYKTKISEEDYKINLLRNSGKYIHNGKSKKRIIGW